MIAESLSDWEALDYLYHSGIVFGAFMLYHYADDKSKTSAVAKFMQKNFPLGYGLMRVSIVKGWANQEEPKEGVQANVT